MFYKAVHTQDVTNPASIPSFYCLYDIPRRLDSLQYFIFHTIGPTGLLHPSPAPHFKTFQLFLIYFPKCPKFQHHTIAVHQMEHFTSYVLKLKSYLLVKRVFSLLIAAFAMPILELISRMHLAALVIMLPEQLKYSTSSGSFCFDLSYCALGMTDVAIQSNGH